MANSHEPVIQGRLMTAWIRWGICAISDFTILTFVYTVAPLAHRKAPKKNYFTDSVYSTLRSCSGGLENEDFRTSSSRYDVLWLMEKCQRNSTKRGDVLHLLFFSHSRFIFQAYLDYCDRKGNLVMRVEHLSRCRHFHRNWGIVTLK